MRISYLILVALMLIIFLRGSIVRNRQAALAEKYRNESRTDALTGLNNKGAYIRKEEELTRKLLKSRKEGDDFTFAIGNFNNRILSEVIPLDNSKTVFTLNDYGKVELHLKELLEVLFFGVSSNIPPFLEAIRFFRTLMRFLPKSMFSHSNAQSSPRLRPRNIQIIVIVLKGSGAVSSRSNIL